MDGSTTISPIKSNSRQTPNISALGDSTDKGKNNVPTKQGEVDNITKEIENLTFGDKNDDTQVGGADGSTMFSTIDDIQHYASSVGSIAQEFGLRPSAMTNIIGSRVELELYENILDKDIYDQLVKSYNDGCTGHSFSRSKMVFVFKENCRNGREEQITWWHEQTHCAYNNLTLGDIVKLSNEALDWLEENAPSKYDFIRGHYQREKWESEGVAVFIEELIERYGTSNFMTSDFANLGGLAKLADVIRYSIKYGTEETRRKIKEGYRFGQSSAQSNARVNSAREDSSTYGQRIDGGRVGVTESALRETSQGAGVLNPRASEDNAGNYSNASNDIRFSIANRNQVGFVSNAMKAVEGIKQEKATPSQWLAMIQKQGGLKAGEDKWLGLSEWLKGSDAMTLTKDEVLEFIGENMIQIEEVNYTETADSFNELKEEYENLVREEGFDAANEEMSNRYGDDFYIAFDDLGGELTIANEEAAAALLGSDNIINRTRLDYTTEGLDNKREIALTVPTVENWNSNDVTHFGDAGDGRAVAWIRFGETFAYDVIDDVQVVDDFHAPYENFSGRNVYKPIGGSARDYVAHGKGRNGEMIYVVYINEKQLPVAHATLEDARMAMNEYYKEHPRKLRKPRKVLVIDEIQSKRHQEGREKGYRSNADKFLKDNGIEVVETDTHFEFYKNGEIDKSFAKALLNDIEEAKNLYVAGYEKTGVPSAPFDKNWHELAIKRMLRLAAEEGFDKVAWTKGEQQAKRYDLGHMVDEINVYDTYDGTHQVQGTKDGIQVFSEQTTNGEAGLAELIGKEMARKAYSNLHEGKDDYLVNGGYVSLKGEHLIGGEGMKGFYDKMLPSFLNKYGKKWGAKVGEVTLPEVEEDGRTMWAIDVTPEMKESVGEQTMFSAKRKAPETESVLEEEHQPSVVSSADGAKILKDLDSLIKDYDENANKRPNTFLGDIAQALGATKHGSNSQYATFETMNGNIVTIRLSNHNARVSTFDNHNEQEGISIVVTAQDNNGVDNDGTAHVVEFFYDAIKLRKADGKPLVEILKSIKQSLYSGVYKDTTGLAEREEVNTMFSTVYHGSSSKFDKFDHSFMGTGEGNQAFGWGTYVSEVKGIAKTYAGISGQTMMTYKGQELDTESFYSPWRIIKDLYGESGGRLRDMRNRAERILGMVEEDNVDMKKLWQNVVDTLKKVRAGELKVKPSRQLYTVEIPDDNGHNYLYHEVEVPTNVKRDVKQRLYEVLAADDAYKGAERELRQELDHVFNLEQDGATLYGNVSAYLGSDKAASEFLNAMGFVGIKYPTNTLSGGNKDGSSNYVIFNDSDLAIEDRTMFSFAKTPEEFDIVQREAERQKGIVVPGLAERLFDVVDVPRHDFTGRGIDAINKARAWAIDNIQKEHIYHEGEEDSFKYEIDEETIGKFLSNSSTTGSDNLGIHLAVLKKLPEVIDKSIEVEIHPDYKKKDGKRRAENGVDKDNLLVHRMYGAVMIDGKVYRTKTTMHEFRGDTNKPHDYKITEVKLIVSGSSTSNARTSLTSIDGAKLLENIEKSYDTGVKLLDAEKNSESPSLFSIRPESLAPLAEELGVELGELDGKKSAYKEVG